MTIVGTSPKRVWNATILGEPASKSNSRRLVRRGHKLMVIKSKKALDYLRTFREQCPRLKRFLEGDLRADLIVHYASRRPDLDASLIFDAMQGFIYENDRQIKEQHLYWKLDKLNPRTIIKMTEL